MVAAFRLAGCSGSTFGLDTSDNFSVSVAGTATIGGNKTVLQDAAGDVITMNGGITIDAGGGGVFSLVGAPLTMDSTRDINWGSVSIVDDGAGNLLVHSSSTQAALFGAGGNSFLGSQTITGSTSARLIVAASNAGISASGFGALRFNTATNHFEISENGGAYVQLGGGGRWRQAVTSLTAGAGLTASPTTITTTGSFALDLTHANT